MNDSTTNNDATAIGYVLVAAMCIGFGVYLGNRGRESDQVLIYQQSQEIRELKQQLTETKAKFDGYQMGRGY
jgi:hypothetical protein